MTFGQRLRQERENRGFTRKEISDRTGIHISSLHGYEHDINEPSLFNATLIADVLGVSLDLLAGRDKKRLKNLERIS